MRTARTCIKLWEAVHLMDAETETYSMKTPSVQASSPADQTLMRFVGRQPILDIDMKVYGHELLFRSGTSNAFSGDEEQATQSIIDNSLLLLSEDSREITFINCTRESLLSGIVTLLPPESTVLEILERIDSDPELLECCRRLKNAGYRFALDDFSHAGSQIPLLEIAEFIKVDFMASDSEARARIYDVAGDRQMKFIAEKLETEQDVEAAWSEGCEFFQGYYFCKPIMTATRVIPQNQLVYMRLLTELSREPANLLTIEQLVMSDTSICYRLLRLVNSALYALPYPVTSIRGALMMIGEDEFRKLVTVALANVVGTRKSKAATRVALERAKFCELLAPLFNESPGTLYLLGMLSLIDVILGMPMPQILGMLPLDSRMKAALLGEQGPLTLALDLVRAREAGGWLQATSIQESIGLAGSTASRFYLEAIQWADRINMI